MSFNDAAFTVLLQCKTLATIKWGCYNTPKEKQILFGKEDGSAFTSHYGFGCVSVKPPCRRYKTYKGRTGSEFGIPR